MENNSSFFFFFTRFALSGEQVAISLHVLGLTTATVKWQMLVLDINPGFHCHSSDEKYA